MATNVFGTPITDETLRGLRNRNHRDKDYITQIDRARVAMEMKNAEGKDVNAREMAEYLKEQFGAEDDVVTMGLIYNATGCAITVVQGYEREGHLGQYSPYPSVIQNGQWGVFVHGKCGNDPNYSKASVVYSGKINSSYNYHWCIGWASNHTTALGQNQVLANIFYSGYNDDDEVNALLNSLDSVERRLVCTCNASGGFMICSIGNDRVAFLETILTLPEAIN